MRNLFIQELIKEAKKNEKIVLVVGDLGFNVIEPFKNRFPNRFFNAGVSEQSMIALGQAFNLAKIISKFVDGCEIFIENKKGETNHFLYDVSKIENEINFTAKSKPNFKILKPWFDKINLN